MINLIDSLMKEAVAASENHSHLRLWLQATCVFAGVWGIAGVLNTSSMDLFDTYYRQLWRGTVNLILIFKSIVYI